jgi:site-specific DNA-methyltransferase (adenine-specific)
LVWDKGMHTPLGYYMQNVEFIVLFRKGGARKINNMGSTALISIKGIRGNKIHPSEKPVELYDHLILNSSNINDICIDPFGGSGTIIESCLKNNRQFIAIEKDPNHFEKMKRRADFNKNFEPQTLFRNEM